MTDAIIFWVGVFTTLWVVMFFGFSAYELRKTYSLPRRVAVKLDAPAVDGK